MKTCMTVVLFAFLLVSTVQASRPRATLGPGVGGANFRTPYHETTHRALSPDTTYVLTGWYFIDSTYSITIPAGTLIVGDSASGGTLIVSRGARLYANGTFDKPIIFTSAKPAGTRVPGDWGGVIILGAAPTNKPTTQQIEGGFGTIPNTTAMYGGSDPNDTSGVMTYVRIEFAGIAFAQDNEINGLTFGGVGAGTLINHIQVSYANDDDYEFFGGTVQAKYLVGYRSLDDCFDTDFGFAGRLQFMFTKRDPNIFDASASGSSNGEESDNEGTSPFTATPRTNARFSNWTLVGPLSDTANQGTLNSHWGYTAMLRRATELSIYNSIMMGWKNGINLRDTLTQRAAIDGRLELSNISLQAPRNMVVLSASPTTPNIAGFDPVVWFNDAAKHNIGSTARQASDIGLPAELWNLDRTINPVPPPASEPAVAGTSYQGRLAGDTWFDSVSYRGAFDPNLPRTQQWDAGWTNYDPQNYDPEADGVAAVSVIDGWNMLSLPYRNADDPNSPGTTFSTGISVAFQYNAGYVPVGSLNYGPGYWKKFGGSQVAYLWGHLTFPDSLPLVNGWNLIGSFPQSVSTANLTTTPAGLVNGATYFGYNGSYYTTNTLVPGQAYWVRSSGPGQLIASAAGAAQKSAVNPLASVENTVVVRDAAGKTATLYFGRNTGNASAETYHLPPVPPEGALDARFASQSMLLPVAADAKEIVLPLQLQGRYPLTVSLGGKDVAGKKAEVLMYDNGSLVERRPVQNGTVVVADTKINRLQLRLADAVEAPKSFALSQNYPNPFNPTTSISIAVPFDAHVTVTIFNMLGQKIATLLDGATSAGLHTLVWDGTNAAGLAVPSGSYIVRMSSDGFASARKMMLLK